MEEVLGDGDVGLSGPEGDAEDGAIGEFAEEGLREGGGGGGFAREGADAADEREQRGDVAVDELEVAFGASEVHAHEAKSERAAIEGEVFMVVDVKADVFSGLGIEGCGGCAGRSEDDVEGAGSGDADGAEFGSGFREGVEDESLEFGDGGATVGVVVGAKDSFEVSIPEGLEDRGREVEDADRGRGGFAGGLEQGSSLDFVEFPPGRFGDVPGEPGVEGFLALDAAGDPEVDSVPRPIVDSDVAVRNFEGVGLGRGGDHGGGRSVVRTDFRDRDRFSTFWGRRR